MIKKDIGREYIITYFKVIYEIKDVSKSKAFKEEDEYIIIDEFYEQLEKLKNRNKKGVL